MFSLFNNPEIDIHYKNNNTFIFIGNNYKDRSNIIDNISLSSELSLYLIFVNSSNNHLFKLSQEIAQSYSTMYPGNNKFIILDDKNFINDYSRFGDIILSTDMYNSPKYNKEFKITDNNRIQIQCGCINRCKFCINEQHKSVSISHLDIIKQIKKLSCKDIMLSGVNITSYRDGEETLSSLCESIFNNCKEVEILKLAGLDLQQFEEVKKVINVLKRYNKDNSILHFPIHTCNNELLKANNLDYSIEQIEEIMSLCNKNHVLYSCDIICGLPTETEEMFNDTIEMVKKYKPAFVYIYPFRLLNGKYKKVDLIDSEKLNKDVIN